MAGNKVFRGIGRRQWVVWQGSRLAEKPGQENDSRVFPLSTTALPPQSDHKGRSHVQLIEKQVWPQVVCMFTG